MVVAVGIVEAEGLVLVGSLIDSPYVLDETESLVIVLGFVVFEDFLVFHIAVGTFHYLGIFTTRY